MIKYVTSVIFYLYSLLIVRSSFCSSFSVPSTLYLSSPNPNHSNPFLLNLTTQRRGHRLNSQVSFFLDLDKGEQKKIEFGMNIFFFFFTPENLGLLPYIYESQD